MEFLYHFGPVFTLSSLAILCAGTFGGLLLGATPGLSPTMAVALLIPFTFHMDPAQGLMLLGAAYTATVAGGAVSAILLKIPGAPANIATALDGYEMARKGEGAKALQLCFISSFIGGYLIAWLGYRELFLFGSALTVLGTVVFGLIFWRRSGQTARPAPIPRAPKL